MSGFSFDEIKKDDHQHFKEKIFISDGPPFRKSILAQFLMKQSDGRHNRP